MSERRIQALQDQNEALKQANDLLEQQFKLTDKDAVRTEDIKKVARNILKEYGSKYSSEILKETCLNSISISVVLAKWMDRLLQKLQPAWAKVFWKSQCRKIQN